MDKQTLATLIKKYPSLAILNSDVEWVESHDGREERLLEYILKHPKLPQMKGHPQRILDAIDEYAFQKEFLINIGPDKAKIMTNLISEEKPTTVIECGGYIGYSAICFADAMQQAMPEAAKAGQLHYWSLELDQNFCSISEQLVDLAGLSHIVKFVPGSANESLHKLCAEWKLVNVDLLFLDHVEDLYVQEFDTAEKLGLLKPGVLVVADNVLKPGAPKYREHVRSHPKLESKAVAGLIMPGEFGDELEVSRVLS